MSLRSRWFGVDLLCAIVELRTLGMAIDPAREQQIRATIAARGEATRRRREAAAASRPHHLLDTDYPDEEIFWDPGACEPADRFDDDFLDELPF